MLILLCNNFYITFLKKKKIYNPVTKCLVVCQYSYGWDLS